MYYKWQTESFHTQVQVVHFLDENDIDPSEMTICYGTGLYPYVLFWRTTTGR